LVVVEMATKVVFVMQISFGAQFLCALVIIAMGIWELGILFAVFWSLSLAVTIAAGRQLRQTAREVRARHGPLVDENAWPFLQRSDYEEVQGQGSNPL
jgi:hypothetical protein